VIPAVIVSGIVFFMMSAIFAKFHHGHSDAHLYEHYANWTEAAAVIQLVTAGCLVFMQTLTKLRLLAFTLLMMLSVQLAIAGFESLSPMRSAFSIAQLIRPHLKPDTRVYSVGRYDQSLPPYLGRAVVLVAYTDEMSFGLTQEPERWLTSVEEFEREWISVPRAIAIMTPEAYQSSVSRGLPLRLLSQSEDRIVVVKPEWHR
jgi:hypothetical protein